MFCKNPLSATPCFKCLRNANKIISENFGPKNARFSQFEEMLEFQYDTKI